MVVSDDDLHGLLDERRAAEFLRLSVRTLQAARQDDLLAAACLLPRFEKHGRRVVYRRAEVEAVLAARLDCPRLRKKYRKREGVAA